MASQFAHVKNPLTIIAIFAGLAQTSGTVVLPLLVNDVQTRFVWFVMLFPCLLLTLFFIALFFKRVVLYAPSDFSDEKLFANLIIPSTETERIEKMHDELSNLNNSQETTTVLATVGSTDTVDSAPLKTQEFNRREFLGKYIIAEELAFLKLSQEYNVQFNRHARVAGTSFILDGIHFSKNENIIVEVKLVKGSNTSAMIRNTLSKILSATISQPKGLSNLKFVLVCVIDSGDIEIADRLRASFLKESSRFPFRSEIKLYTLQELEAEFSK